MRGAQASPAPVGMHENYYRDRENTFYVDRATAERRGMIQPPEDRSAIEELIVQIAELARSILAQNERIATLEKEVERLKRRGL